MKNIQFYNLPKLLSFGRLMFDGDKKDLRLHSEENFNWGGRTKREYTAASKAIDKISYKGEGWQVYAWYDVSSYEYWMKVQKEQNYIQVTIAFDKATVKETEVEKINAALDKAMADAEAISNKYCFHPSYIQD